MNPFDAPPATPPVSFDPPPPGEDGPRRRRGRMALVSLAAAGLVGGGLVGISQFVSADRPTIVDDAALAAVDAPDDDVNDGDDVESDGESDDDRVVIDGEVVIDLGDGDPVVIDLGDAAAALDEFNECLGLPQLGGPFFDFELGDGPLGSWEPGEWDGSELEEWLGDLPLGELPHGEDFGVFDLGGTHVTVAGPDGVSVIDLGEGDGSVTITKRGDEVTITTDGDATVEELPGWFEAGPLDLEGVDELDELDELFGEDFDPEAMFGELFGDDFDPEAMFDELFGEDFDPEALVDEFLGGEIELGELPVLERPEQLEECLAVLQGD